MIATASLMRMGALMAGLGVWVFVICGHGVVMYAGLYSCLALVALLVAGALFVQRQHRCPPIDDAAEARGRAMETTPVPLHETFTFWDIAWRFRAETSNEEQTR